MKKLTLKILGGLIIGILLLQSSASIAASSVDGLTNEKQQNQEEINDVTQQKKEVTAQKNQTVKEVEELDSQITDYENQIAELDTKINDLNNQITEAEEKLNQAQEDYTKQEKLLEERLVVIQESGETSYLDFILSSDSITDLISNYYLASEIAMADTELLQTIQKQKEEIEKAKTDLENSKKDLDTTKASKQGVATQLQTAKNEKSQKVAELSQEEQELQARIDELNEANKSIDAKIQAAIKAAEEENNKNNGSSGGSNGGGSTGGGSISSSGFIYPVPSAYSRITTGLYYSSGQYHGAVDFGTGGINGQPIYAVADGLVIVSERLSGSYGNYIIIMHDNGLFTLYAHGQDGSRTVSAGQRVKQGQQIMRVGSTGNSTGPHLHFEVRTSPGKYANRVNPMNYLP